MASFLWQLSENIKVKWHMLGVQRELIKEQWQRAERMSALAAEKGLMYIISLEGEKTVGKVFRQCDVM